MNAKDLLDRARKIIGIDVAKSSIDLSASILFDEMREPRVFDTGRYVEQPMAKIPDDVKAKMEADTVKLPLVDPSVIERFTHGTWSNDEVRRALEAEEKEKEKERRRKEGAMSRYIGQVVAAFTEDDFEVFPTDDAETSEALFKREWEEMIGLYRIATSGTAMAAEGSMQLRVRMEKHGLKLPRALTECTPNEVIDSLAPRYLLKPAKMPSGPFGPSVTADSAEQLADITKAMMDDPRVRQQARAAGYIFKSTPR